MPPPFFLLIFEGSHKKAEGRCSISQSWCTLVTSQSSNSFAESSKSCLLYGPENNCDWIFWVDFCVWNSYQLRDQMPNLQYLLRAQPEEVNWISPNLLFAQHRELQTENIVFFPKSFLGSYSGFFQVRWAKRDVQPNIFWGSPLQRYKDPKPFKVISSNHLTLLNVLVSQREGGSICWRNIRHAPNQKFPDSWTFSPVKIPRWNPFARRFGILGVIHAHSKRNRVVSKHGRLNTYRRAEENQESHRFLKDFFTSMIDLPWSWTLLSFATSFIISWVVFAGIWYLVVLTHGDLSLQLPDDHVACVDNIQDFTSCFLFSLETQHTIGWVFVLSTKSVKNEMSVQVRGSGTHNRMSTGVGCHVPSVHCRRCDTGLDPEYHNHPFLPIKLL